MEKALVYIKGANVTVKAHTAEHMDGKYWRIERQIHHNEKPSAVFALSSNVFS